MNQRNTKTAERGTMLQLKEPSTTITDALLVFLSALFGAILIVRGNVEAAFLSRMVLWGWAFFFFCCALTSFIGVIDHGFAIGTRFEAPLDKGHASVVGIVALTYYFLSTMFYGGWAFAWRWSFLPIAAFVVYDLCILRRYDYLYFTIYGLVLLAPALVFNVLALMHGVPTISIIVGLAFSLLGAIAQAAKWRWRCLNHNDLYHLCYAAMFVAVLRGAFSLAAYLAGG